jgi:hypothetical protein
VALLFAYLDYTDIAQKTNALIHHQGAIRGIDPSRNFEILHLSISGRPSPLSPHDPATRLDLQSL